MSTPIFDLLGRAARVAACLFLAGCSGSWFWAPRNDAAPAPTHATVTSDRIVVTGPEGFCVDPTATLDQTETGFLLLGNCAAIANSRRAAQPTTPAILTATISERRGEGRLADDLDQLDDFFRSAEGLALISRSSDPKAVVVLDTATMGEVFLLHVIDRSDSPITGVQPNYWRAYLDIGPRIATLSVLALQDRSLSRNESLAILRRFVQAVQQANPQPETEAPPPEPTDAAVQAQSQSQGNPLASFWNFGMFRRIVEE
jgi:hypothetical protein